MSAIRVIQIGEHKYKFFKLKNRVVVELQNRCEEELAAIGKAYLQDYETLLKKKGGWHLRGKWQLCQNPRCQRAVYLAPWRMSMSKKQNCFCSLYCQGKVRSGVLCSQWFDSLTLWKQAGWIVETARLGARAPRRVKKLEMLLEWEAERVRDILKLIWVNFPRAKKIIEKFLEKEAGKALKANLNKSLDLNLNKESGLFSFQSRENFNLTTPPYHGKIRAIARNLPKEVFHSWWLLFGFGVVELKYVVIYLPEAMRRRAERGGASRGQRFDYEEKNYFSNCYCFTLRCRRIFLVVAGQRNKRKPGRLCD